ncbi:hypothetical protein PIB30_078030 [Stylosanthes scabra]|uniref:Putative plant transposon protein domain-containing protein n=1 Tax=Stylosanthes scabra TaxID=79078 RepID=A0ABU6WU62_9FABA|nr:hypothetical protein [Stylosanthes scabra]
MTFQRRMTLEIQDLDAVIGDLCNPNARWACGAGGVPQHLKKRDLVPLARGWHEFTIHAILPTTNKSKVTLKRAILIHAIMKGQEVRAERLIEEHIFEIVTSLHLDKPPLAFPNIIARLCEAANVPIEPDVPIPTARPIIISVMQNIRYPRQQPQQHQQFHEGYADQEQHAEHAQGFPEAQGSDKVLSGYEGLLRATTRVSKAATGTVPTIPSEASSDP